MSLADELEKLQSLRDAGTLNDAEFAQAKRSLIDGSVNMGKTLGDGLGDAAKTWVKFQIVMAVIGLILAAIFFFGFFLPHLNSMPGSGFPGNGFPGPPR
jgi:hypothetical protein